MQRTNWHPVDVLPTIGALVDAGMAHVDEERAFLGKQGAESRDLTLARLARFAHDIAALHAAYEERLAQWPSEPMGPEVELELARIRSVLARMLTTATVRDSESE